MVEYSLNCWGSCVSYRWEYDQTHDIWYQHQIRIQSQKIIDCLKVDRPCCHRNSSTGLDLIPGILCRWLKWWIWFVDGYFWVFYQIVSNMLNPICLAHIIDNAYFDTTLATISILLFSSMLPIYVQYYHFIAFLYFDLVLF